MATVASLQIKLGADVTSAINGLSKAEFAAKKVEEAFDAANQKSITAGFVVAGWAANVNQAAQQVQRSLDAINLDELDDAGKKNVSLLKNVVGEVTKLSNSVTSMGAAFSGANQVAGAALSTIARIAPTLAPGLVALAGPIGLVVGGIAALTAGYLSLSGTSESYYGKLDDQKKSVVDQQAAFNLLIERLRDTNTTYKEKNEIINTINQQYGTTLKNLTSEGQAVKGLEEAYTSVSKAIGLKIAIQAREEQLLSLEKERIAILDQQKKATENLTAAQQAFNTISSLPQGFSAGQIDVATNRKTTALKGQRQAQEDLNKINAQAQEIDKKFLSVQDDVRDSYKQLSGLGLNFNPLKNSKAIESDSQKIKTILNNLARDYETNQTLFEKGIIPGTALDKLNEAATGSAFKAIVKIDPDYKGLDEINQRIKDFEKNRIQGITFTIKPEIDTFIYLDTIDDLRNETFAKLDEIDAKFRFTGDPAQALAQKIRTVESALQELGTLGVTVDDDAVQVLLNELIILRSQTQSPLEIKVNVTDLQKVANTISQVGSALSSVNGIIGQFEENNIQKRSQELDAYYERQKELIEQQPQLESTKNKKLEQLDKEVNQKRKQIQKDQAAANKRKAIFEAIINTAAGIARALADGGPVLAAVAGAIGLAQIAAIQSQPLPALAKGGLVSGPSAVLVGEYPGAQSNPEFISPIKTAQKYIREAVREEGGIQELYSFISNDDLVLIGRKGEYRTQRLRG